LNDLDYGTRDKRGHWHPNEALRTGPLLEWPWSLRRVLAWLPGYLAPYNLLFLMLAALVWIALTPSKGSMETLEWGWALWILLRNALIILLIFGGFELWLYVRRRQGHAFKYNPAFPADKPSKVFLFGRQGLDNALRTFGTGIPIWSAYEILILHAWAKGWGPWTSFSDNPIWLVLFGLLIPLIHELHFYCIHRLIHLPLLYRHIHSVHHNSVNPSPWSSLSMHPVEHLLYWSDALIHLILPSHPLFVLYHLQVTGTGAIIGHIGFDRIEIGEDRAVDTQAYAHYLHHKYFEVNYANGALPFDRWFGTWHDGTLEGERAMKDRLKRIQSHNDKPAEKQP
jgi:sterol desaturase/sphingolipid hydroxylase (fatty acid hydroxylase superfamily)